MPEPTTRAPTGVPGLDNILFGGLWKHRMYLVDGNPGVGKTTLALQFLLKGRELGERGLYITLSETREELDAVAESHGWSLEGIEIIELSQVQGSLGAASRNTLFQPAEVELSNLSALLLDEFARIKPDRLVLDSLSEMRLMAQNPLRYRRQILAFKQHFADQRCTVLLLDDRTGAAADVQVQSIVHGVICLEVRALKFGINRRFLSISKLRGSRFREGHHDYVIRSGELIVFPRLVAEDHGTRLSKDLFSSGNEGLDLLSGGGFHAGTGNLLIGPAGSGKSTVSTMFAVTAAAAGRNVLFFAFDESPNILIGRAREIGMDIDAQLESGRLRIEQVDPAEVAPGELAARIVAAAEEEQVRMVVLDSLNGYVNAMPQEEFLHLHLHELLTYLNQRGVVTIMTLAQHGLIGPMGTPVDVSYLADTVMLMRFFEAQGAIRKAVSVVKKRTGFHESTIREMRMRQDSITLTGPLVDFEGVMTGVPKYLGGALDKLDAE